MLGDPSPPTGLYLLSLTCSYKNVTFVLAIKIVSLQIAILLILEPAMARNAGSYEWGSALQPWMSWLGLDEQGNVLIGLLCFIQPAILFLLLPFMCPIFIVFMEYLSVLFLHVQRYRGLISNNFSYASAEASRKILAKYWCLWSQIWHGGCAFNFWVALLSWKVKLLCSCLRHTNQS